MKAKHVSIIKSLLGITLTIINLVLFIEIISNGYTTTFEQWAEVGLFVLLVIVNIAISFIKPVKIVLKEENKDNPKH